ncbi:unnamed protein product (macronuclear) [Paramecium tetraurelia]|uniref:B box-type domain-containing protein n=1 Tax=Paramecium tetraurelia TaxID=5888 RepID=A0CPM4_PARTE|nr:uncharacterized protein GSPATT00009133001 [Paramecium tetraurelia]CAK72741.1 unnamed protein product [Paramecium tetraurelia]|eukprot:XP_001440138.1 hypothetical protein (macronuclear) [Paramecium tetraurelia strain d4-2]
MRKAYEQDYINNQNAGLLQQDDEDQNDGQTKSINYIRPRPFPHENNRECKLDVVCHENECRILQKLCCQECAHFVHPNHKTDSLDWYINHIREKIKRRHGVQQTTTHEISVLKSEQRKKRMKYMKYIIKQLKKVEKECRSIEDTTEQKIKIKLSSTSRKEAFDKMIRLLKLVRHQNLDQFKQHHQEFLVKDEVDQQMALQYNEERERKELQRQISEIVDQFFLADERERQKLQQNQSLQTQQQEEIKALRLTGGLWERNMNKLAGALKRFSKRMLSHSKMSIRPNSSTHNIVLVEVDLATNEDDPTQTPKILQILPLNAENLITVHPNEIKLWKYSKCYLEFKPIAPLPFLNLKYVCVADKKDEFVVLFGDNSIMSISSKSMNSKNKQFICPKQGMTLYRILISPCQNFLIASGGCKQNCFYVIIWQFNDAKIRKVLRYQYSFPNEGDLLMSETNQHIFRCNKNKIDVFGLIDGVKKQTLQLQNVRDCIEQATILHNFQEQDTLCVSTNRGFYVYTYDDNVVENNYKLVYSFSQTCHCIFHVFYQYGLEEEGFMLAALENNETKVKFQDLNNKILLSGIQFDDQILTGKLIFQREFQNQQLVLLLGFESGKMRVLKFIKK